MHRSGRKHEHAKQPFWKPESLSRPSLSLYIYMYIYVYMILYIYIHMHMNMKTTPNSQHLEYGQSASGSEAALNRATSRKPARLALPLLAVACVPPTLVATNLIIGFQDTPPIAPPSQSKAQIRLNEGLFGPFLGMGGWYRRGVSVATNLSCRARESGAARTGISLWGACCWKLSDFLAF